MILGLDFMRHVNMSLDIHKTTFHFRFDKSIVFPLIPQIGGNGVQINSSLPLEMQQRFKNLQ